MRVASTFLILAVLTLLTLGLVVLYSASMVQVGGRYLGMQLLWCAVGLVACVAATFVDYRWFKRFRFSTLLLLLVVGLLTVVLIPGIGVMRGGSRRWFDFGFISFQPSELAKLALIIALAHYGERNGRQMSGWVRGVVYPGLIILPVLGLIISEPDFGATMMIGTVSGMVLLVAGVRWHHFLPPLVAVALVIGVAIANDPVRMGRVQAWLEALENPEKAKNGINDQGYEAVTALGNGGWFGVGLGRGRQKYGFVPEHHTDFIFSMVGEELGAVTTMAVVMVVVVLVLSGVFIAWNARDTFGLLLGCGITFLIGMQALINIGVVTLVLPNKGMPFPFLSYGGSNLLLLLTGVGILLSIARHAAVNAEFAGDFVDSNKTLTDAP